MAAVHDVCCCANNLSLLYVQREYVPVLRTALAGALVVALLPVQQGEQQTGRWWRARQVVKAAIDAETGVSCIQLCDGFTVPLEQLSDVPFESFSPAQRRCLCCELSWQMHAGLHPRLQADKVREAELV